MIATVLRNALRLAAPFLLLATAPVQAGDDSAPAGPPPTPPSVGDPVPFDMPASYSVMLENGLTATFIPWGMTPTVDIIVSVRAGNLDDGSDTWIADLTAAMMEEGSAGRSKQETASLFGDMGGNLNVSVTESHSTFGTFVMSEHADAAMALLADAVREPDFPEDRFERVREAMIRDVSVMGASPQVTAGSAAFGHLFAEDHPFHRGLPTEAQLRSYGLSDLRQFYRENFGARRTHLYIAGRFDPAMMEAAVRRHFGDWPVGPEDNAPDAAPTVTDGPVVHFIDRPGAPQTTVQLYYPVSEIDAKNAYAIDVMDVAVGGLIASRARMAGYSYSAGSFVRWTRGGGYWSYSDDINTPDTPYALADVLNMIDAVRGVTWNLDGTREWMASLFVMSVGSTSGLIGEIAYRDSFGLPHEHLSRHVDRLMAVTDEEVTAVANAYLEPDNMVLIVVGDLDRIEADIRAINQLREARFVRE